MATVVDVTWSIGGYRAEHIVGFGASGEVWRGVSERSGHVVALKRLRVGSAADDRQRLRREAALLGALEHPHLLRLREVVEQGSEVVLVLDLAEGGSLAGLLGRRGQLLTGEVVTAVAPIADALASAHAHGFVHGDVSPGNILLTADGKPLLADLGTARLVGAGGGVHCTPGYAEPAVAQGVAPTPASDVYALAALAVQALTGALPDSRVGSALEAAGAPPVLREFLGRCLDPQPARRPGAGAVSRTLLAACPPVPLHAVGAESAFSSAALTHAVPGAGTGRGGTGRDGAEEAAAGRGPGRLGRARRWLVGRRRAPEQQGAAGRHRAAAGAGARRRPRIAARVVVAIVAVAGAAVIGVLWGTVVLPEQPASMPMGSSLPASSAPPASSVPPARSAPPAGSVPPASSAPTTADWSAVLDGLDASRATAFATADAAALRQVYAPGSQALLSDEAAVRSLSARHGHATGVRHHVLAVRAIRSAASAAVLRVDDEMSAYDVLDQSGRVVERTPARGRRSMTVRLVRTAGGWRILSLSRTTG